MNDIFKKQIEAFDLLDDAVTAAQKAVYAAEKRRDDFLEETFGFRGNSVATLRGTILMTAKIIDMKAQKSD